MVLKNQKAFTLNHLKLIVRGGLFLWAIALYVIAEDFVKSDAWFLALTGGLFIAECIMKLFPLRWESMGSQKQFEKNFVPGKEKIRAEIKNGKRVLVVAILWVILNGIVAHLYFRHIIDMGIIILISLFYSVCDMICVLFYCPFQKIMGNKCCTTCRIHNWDYIMIATPLVFIDSVFARVIFCMGAVIFARWEYTLWRHPERFCEKTNANLTCARCREIRCSRKSGK